MRFIALLLTIAILVGTVAGLGSTLIELGFDTAHRELGTTDLPSSTDYRHAAVEVEGGVEYNFGSMELNSIGSHAFVLRNTGDSPLLLTVDDTTCKCTIGTLARNEIPPGESVEVKLEWTPHDVSEAFRQRATILTNDSDKKELQLTIVGRVIVAVRAIPRTLSLGSITVSEPHSATTRVYGFREEGFQIIDHEFTQAETADYFRVEWRALSQDEVAGYPDATSGFEVTAFAEPGLPLGAFEQQLQLTTDLAEVDPVVVRLEGKVVGDISFMGAGLHESANNLLVLDLVRRGEGRTVKLFVLVKGPYRDDVQLAISEIEPAGVLQATIGTRQEVNEGQLHMYTLEVTVPPDAESISRAGGRSGTLGHITLETNHPISPQVTLKVSFAVEG